MNYRRKKRLKSFISFGILVLVVFSLAGCGNNNTATREDATIATEDQTSISTEDQTSVSTEDQSPSAEEVVKENPIKIEDIDWSVEEGIIDGERLITFNYTNNSQYTITDIEMEFVQKEGTTAEQLAVFDELKADNDWSDEKVQEIYILGYNHKFADPGETLADSPCLINGTSYLLVENIEQYELMEPDMATIDYIGEDGKMYEEYYDFKTQKYSESTQGGKDMHEWSDSRICSRLPEANFREVIVSYDNEDYSFFFFAYGVSREDYEAYIEACKEKGFTDDVSIGDFWFRASNSADGYYVDLNYVADEESMTCLIKIIEE